MLLLVVACPFILNCFFACPAFAVEEYVELDSKIDIVGLFSEPVGSLWVSAKFKHDGEKVEIINTDGGYSESLFSETLNFRNHKVNSWYDPEYGIAQVESVVYVDKQIGIKKLGITIQTHKFQVFLNCNKDGGKGSGSNITKV